VEGSFKFDRQALSLCVSSRARSHLLAYPASQPRHDIDYLLLGRQVSYLRSTLPGPLQLAARYLSNSSRLSEARHHAFAQQALWRTSTRGLSGFTSLLMLA
jgi:hypothetical protein